MVNSICLEEDLPERIECLPFWAVIKDLSHLLLHTETEEDDHSVAFL